MTLFSSRSATAQTLLQYFQVITEAALKQSVL